MKIEKIIVAAGMAIAMGGLAAPSVAQSIKTEWRIPVTSDVRMMRTARRLDQMQKRQLDASERLYANRTNARIVAERKVQPAG